LLRRTFASLLLPNGESLVYVKKQLGHHNIQSTVDTYGHFIPGANKAAVDRLDEIACVRTDANRRATEAESGSRNLEEDRLEVSEFSESEGGGPCRTRTYDPLIKSQLCC